MIVLGYDLESTGLLVEQDRIIEVGAVTYDTEAKVPLEIFSAFVRAPGLSEGYISPTGIKVEWLRQYGMSLPDAFGNVQRMIATADPVAVVAHNGENFDKPLTIAELRRESIVGHALEELHWVDTRNDLPFEKEPSSRRLTHLAADHRILNPFEHRSIFDVLTMLQVMDHYPFEAVLENSKIPWITIRSLTGYDDREKAKELRFSWNGEKRIWTKLIKENAYAREEAAAAEKGVKIVRL